MKAGHFMDTPTHVVNICLIKGDKILLVCKQKTKGQYWILPGGKQLSNETDQATLQRELGEEIPELTFSLGARIVERHATQSIGGKPITVSAYLGTITSGNIDPSDDDPIIGTGWFASGEVFDDDKDPENEFIISDATYEILDAIRADGRF
jgi:hypothetical protein